MREGLDDRARRGCIRCECGWNPRLGAEGVATWKRDRVDPKQRRRKAQNQQPGEGRKKKEEEKEEMTQSYEDRMYCGGWCGGCLKWVVCL